MRSLASLGVRGAVSDRPAETQQSEEGRRRIVVCDDEARLASLTAQLLESHGFEAVATTNLAGARKALSDASTHAVVLDVHLAGESPSQLLEFIAQSHQSVRVLVTSGLGEDDVPDEIRRHPSVIGYVAKPYSVEVMARRLGEALKS